MPRPLRRCRGRRWVQALTGAVPTCPPQDLGEADGSLARVTFELDAV